VNSTNQATPEDDPVLRETLKRCSPATYYAACKFRKTGCGDDLRAVILGVVERFVEHDLRPKLRVSSDTLRLHEIVQQAVTQQDYSVTSAVLAVGVFSLLTIFLSWINSRSRRLRPLTHTDIAALYRIRPEACPSLKLVVCAGADCRPVHRDPP